ncbi:MAG TPA: hypothetical protein VEV13_02650 [Candidatus Limnocylindria bacterium]|nr:hypothetical protein [Candidatus Limnocylindria bacterium]
MPHRQALRAFVSGRYRAERDAASESVAAADLARVAAEERLRWAERDEGLAGERLTTASEAASAAHAQADVRQLLSALGDVDRRLVELREQLIRQEAAARAARDVLIAPLLASRS